MGVKTTIQIDINTSTPFEIRPKTNALKELSKLDNDVLEKLAKLSKSKKAVEQLKTNFPMIEGFLG